MDVVKIIKELKAKRGFKTDRELAYYLGIKPTAITNWKNRGRVPIESLLNKFTYDELSDIYTVSELENKEQGGENNNISEPKVEYIQKPDVPDEIKIAFYEVPVSAGEGMFIQDELMTFFYPAKRFHKKTFMVKVKGNSMEPLILDGDELLVDTTRQPVEGNIVIASVWGEMLVKRVKKVNGIILLNPDNPDYEPVEVGHHVKILGVVTKITHDALKN